MSFQPRDRAGRFAASQRVEPSLDLGVTPSGTKGKAMASGADLAQLVRSHEPSDQVIAAGSVDLTRSLAAQLSRGDFAARLVLASRPDYSHMGAEDDDPVVRATALRAGVGISDQVRRKLAGDPRVAAVNRVLGFAHVVD